ncbi:restriction endonuclease subunit S [Lysobacter sp. A03]|uniref:restriction endonuclease subunit S n=1 Tax=Lysobacter sp. A03 TaxID=1199154 RepID=UPI00190F9A3A|nr:restriction endonuclease subunit S [Lysobacter sp. A03]
MKEVSASYPEVPVAAGGAVPSGYKQTEVGLIPEDWAVSTVGAEFHVQLGKMLDSEKNIGVSKLFLGNRSVQWGHVDLSELAKIKLTPSDLRRYRLRAGDLLVCEGGEVGRSAIWTDPIPECYYQKALHRLRPRRGYDVNMMLSVLAIHASTGLLRNYVTQTSIAHLPKEKFETLPIPLPKRAEQEAIAEALSDADALIESLQHLIAKKRQIKQGAMQSLLTGQRRLSGFSDEWERKRLGALLEICHGRSQREVEVRDGRYPILASGGRIGWTNSFLCDRPSVLIGRKGTIDRPQYVDTPFWTVDTLFYSIIRAPNNAKFLFYRFCLIEWKRYNEASGVPSLNARTIEDVEIYSPGADEQPAIAEVLSVIDAEIDGLENRLSKTREIKQGMMQALLTGAIRLPVTGAA